MSSYPLYPLEWIYILTCWSKTFDFFFLQWTIIFLWHFVKETHSRIRQKIQKVEKQWPNIDSLPLKRKWKQQHCAIILTCSIEQRRVDEGVDKPTPHNAMDLAWCWHRSYHGSRFLLPPRCPRQRLGGGEQGQIKATDMDPSVSLLPREK